MKKRLHVKDFRFHKRERSDNMALAQLNKTPSIIIEDDKSNTFFRALNKSKPNPEFWNECKILRESITESDIDAMDALIAQRLNKK